MGNSVLLCLLLTVHIRITRARTYLKMVPYTKIILSLLVILNTAQALPVSQKTDEIEGIAIPVDEAKEFTYELNRDHDLQGSINGGQSGWALEQIDHGVKPEEVISGSRPKRQSDLEASPMAEHLEAPKSTEDGYFGPYEVFRLPSINGPFEQEDDFSIPVFKSYPAIPST